MTPGPKASGRFDNDPKGFSKLGGVAFSGNPEAKSDATQPWLQTYIYIYGHTIELGLVDDLYFSVYIYIYISPSLSFMYLVFICSCFAVPHFLVVISLVARLCLRSSHRCGDQLRKRLRQTVRTSHVKNAEHMALLATQHSHMFSIYIPLNPKP